MLADFAGVSHSVDIPVLGNLLGAAESSNVIG